MSIANQLTEALEEASGHDRASRQGGLAKLRDQYKDDPKTLATLEASDFAEQITEELHKLLKALPKKSGDWKIQHGNALYGRGYYGKVKLVVVGSGSVGRPPMGTVMRDTATVIAWDSAKEKPKSIAKRAFDALRKSNWVGPVPEDFGADYERHM